MARTAVAGRDGHEHVSGIEVVDGNRQQILDTVGAAAQAHVRDIEAIAVSRVERVQDVLGAGVADLAREHVVVAEQRGRRNTGRRVRDGHPVHHGRRLIVAGDGAGDVGAV